MEINKIMKAWLIIMWNKMWKVYKMEKKTLMKAV